MNTQKKKWITILIIGLVIAMLCFFAHIINPFIHSVLIDHNIVMARDGLIVHFVSVGQGDAIAINLPDGKTMIIDAGKKEASVTFSNYIDDYVLSRDRDHKIDYLILTHTDNDHVGGGLRLLEQYDIGTVYIPNLYDDSSDYQVLKDYLNSGEYNIMYHADMTIANARYMIKMMGPVSESSTNNNCPLIKISYMGYDFLFTGDIDSDTESVYVDMYASELDCDVLKVSHHGSKYSTSIDFLSITTPEYAIISCGKNNYGHPSDTVVDRLESLSVETMQTDTLGNIAMVVNEYGLNNVSGDYIISNVYDYWVYLLILYSSIILICGGKWLVECIKLKMQKLNEDRANSCLDD